VNRKKGVGNHDRGSAGDSVGFAQPLAFGGLAAARRGAVPVHDSKDSASGTRPNRVDPAEYRDPVTPYRRGATSPGHNWNTSRRSRSGCGTRPTRCGPTQTTPATSTSCRFRLPGRAARQRGPSQGDHRGHGVHRGRLRKPPRCAAQERLPGTGQRGFGTSPADAQPRAKKGTGPICAKHPPGRSGKLDLSPFRVRSHARRVIGSSNHQAGGPAAVQPWPDYGRDLPFGAPRRPSREPAYRPAQSG